MQVKGFTLTTPSLPQLTPIRASVLPYQNERSLRSLLTSLMKQNVSKSHRVLDIQLFVGSVISFPKQLFYLFLDIKYKIFI